MDKTLIEKICVFLLNNNIKASDIYFHHDEIFANMANIEKSRKGIIAPGAIDHTYN